MISPHDTVPISVAGPAPASSRPAARLGASPFAGSPSLLVDLMLAALVGPNGGTASLDPDGEGALLTLRRGNATVVRVRVPGDVAAAVIGRFARMTGLDPLVERASLAGMRAARITVRVDKAFAELLVTIGATALGISVELRALTLGGRSIDPQRSPPQLRRCPSCGVYQPPVKQRCDADGSLLREVRDDARVGGTIGVYRLLELLGQGAMGQVFAAEHALIGRRVAIKVLRPNLAASADLDARFLFEARAASRLRHPNLVEVTDYGVLANKSPYIVMERLDGESLEHRLGVERALDPSAALRIARAVALGSSVAHDSGIVHNDIKPSNVILSSPANAEPPWVKIIDFGAASLAGTDENGEVVGTAAYMAPERISGERSDVRSDSYSVGVMLYRMIAGRLPFEVVGTTDMFLAHIHKVASPLTSPHCVLPSRVVRLAVRALEKKPAERYQTMKQMIEDIDRALAALSAPAWGRWLP